MYNVHVLKLSLKFKLKPRDCVFVQCNLGEVATGTGAATTTTTTGHHHHVHHTRPTREPAEGGSMYFQYDHFCVCIYTIYMLYSASFQTLRCFFFNFQIQACAMDLQIDIEKVQVTHKFELFLYSHSSFIPSYLNLKIW